jgi:hypothetical protein
MQTGADRLLCSFSERFDQKEAKNGTITPKY